MSIRILRSTTTATPPSLDEGQLAYSENSGNLFIGESGATVSKIGGKTDATKLAGIESGAQVNTVNTVAGRSGDVVITSSDLADFATTVGIELANSDLQDLGNVKIETYGDGQVPTWVTANGQFEAQASASGVTNFTALNDTPASFTANYWTRVNSAGNALEFVQDIDDGTF